MRRMPPGSTRVCAVLLVATVATLTGCAQVLSGASPGSPSPEPSGSSTVSAPHDTAPAETPPSDAVPSAAGVTPRPDAAVAATDGAGNRTAVTVIAVGTTASASVVSAGGYVQDAIEVGGTCTFTLTQGAESVSGTSQAEPDATTTWCANADLTLPRPGQAWTLTLRYESSTSVGVGSVTSAGALS